MAGRTIQGHVGAAREHEPLDAGTSALMATPAPAGARPQAAEPGATIEIPMSGGIPYAVGQASVVRIPIPGSSGLAIELSPRGWVPKTGSTSTLFFQDVTGKRHLRLDYGFNPRTKTIDYHWNHERVFREFAISDHTPVGTAGRVAYQAARYFKYAGRVLIVAGVVIDAISIVQASKPLRRASQVVAGWAAAWAGCKLVGAGGAALATPTTPLGMAAVGVGGCIIGGIAGYAGGSMLAGEVYDWAEGTFFTPLPEVAAP